MNQHQRINNEFSSQYELRSDAILVSPTALAHSVQEVFMSGEEDLHIQYASLEHLKQMARMFLARQKNADGDDNPSHVSQSGMDFGEAFSGNLQDRYPLPRKSGEEPVYKLRSELTELERAWNVQQLRKSAKARQKHADALEAEGQLAAA